MKDSMARHQKEIAGSKVSVGAIVNILEKLSPANTPQNTPVKGSGYKKRVQQGASSQNSQPSSHYTSMSSLASNDAHGNTTNHVQHGAVNDTWGDHENSASTQESEDEDPCWSQKRHEIQYISKEDNLIFTKASRVVPSLRPDRFLDADDTSPSEDDALMTTQENEDLQTNRDTELAAEESVIDEYKKKTSRKRSDCGF